MYVFLQEYRFFTSVATIGCVQVGLLEAWRAVTACTVRSVTTCTVRSMVTFSFNWHGCTGRLIVFVMEDLSWSGRECSTNRVQLTVGCLPSLQHSTHHQERMLLLSTFSSSRCANTLHSVLNSRSCPLPSRSMQKGQEKTRQECYCPAVLYLCTCNMPESFDVNMIMCDVCLSWFHFSCVNLSKEPDCWTCSNCCT